MQKLFPDFTPEQAAKFIEYENGYALIVYPASLEYKNSQHIEVFKDAGFGTRDFVSQFIPFLKILLNGLENTLEY